MPMPSDMSARAQNASADTGTRAHLRTLRDKKGRCIMADRKRSQDGKSETEEFLDKAETPSQQGRAQGNLERKVGTRDTLKRSRDADAGATRVHKSDEKGEGNLGGHHGTGEDKGKEK